MTIWARPLFEASPDKYYFILFFASCQAVYARHRATNLTAMQKQKESLQGSFQ
jgi:hypothetical protein